MQDMNLCINLPGSIGRLPLHVGALKAWFDLGFQRPDEIIASSAGAMAGSSVLGWNESAFDKATKVIGNLTPDNIFSYQRGLKIKLAALGTATFGLGVLILLDHKLSKRTKTFLGLGGVSALLATDAILGNELIHSASHLSPTPLKNLLGSNNGLDFSAIFNSPIRLGVIVTDASKPGEVVFYNNNPLNSDASDPKHRERWLNILLASARLPGKFPFINIDGINTVDGEVWTDFPMRQMKQYKKSIRFDYWHPLQSGSAPKEWISDLSRSFDIMRDRCTQKKIENYELERQNNHALPEIYYVRLSQKLLADMPHIQLHNFTSKQMKELENIGYESVMEQSPAIRKYLDT